MARYTQGIMADGACILRDGVPVTIDSLIGILNRHDIDTATPPADAALADELWQWAGDADVSDRKAFMACIEKCCAALRARAVPEGFALVPVTPSVEMIDAGFWAQCEAARESIKDMWPAMLAASKAAEGK